MLSLRSYPTTPRAWGRAGRARWPAAAPALVVGLLAVALRLPTLVEPHHYADEGIFAAVAQRLLAGQTLYRDAWDNKPPLLFALYAVILAGFGPSMVALRVVGALWAGVAAAGATVLGGRLLGRRAGAAAGALTAIMLAQPAIEANLALTELLAAAPTVWAVALLVGRGPTHRATLVAGALFGVALGFKQTALFDLVAAAGWLVFVGADRWRRLALLLTGAGAVLALLVAPLVLAGAATDTAFALVGFYAVYLGEGDRLTASALILRLGPLTAAALALLAARRGAAGQRRAALVPAWAAAAALAATLGGRPFAHYAVQLAAPLALLLVAVALHWRASAWAAWGARWTLVAVLALLLATAPNPFGRGDPASFAYWGHVARYLALREGRADLDHWFSWRVANQRRLAELMRDDPERTLFVWGEYPWLYPLTGMANPTRFTIAYHTAFVPEGKAEALAMLRANPPRYIVWEREEWRRLPGLDDLLATAYERVAVVDNTELYRRRE